MRTQTGPFRRDNPEAEVGITSCKGTRKACGRASLSVSVLALLLGCAASFAAPTAAAKSARGLQAFQTSVYPLLRSRCAACHVTQPPQIASGDVNRAYDACRTHVDFAAVQSSSLLAKAKDGHCGPACRDEGGEILSALKSWAAQEGGGQR